MSVKLHVVLSIPGKEAREYDYEFDGDTVSIGRDQNNDIQIPLSTVSRNHARIVQEGREWLVEDLQSTHGTKHNGRPLGAGGKRVLRTGDVIDLIHCQLTFSESAAARAPAAADRTEALARKMVEEVLASMGKDDEQPYLRVMNGPEEGRKFIIGVDVSECIIGRGDGCDFQINDVNISRQHATIRRDWNDITIEDMGSKNGVLINGRKIGKPTSMRDADEISLGAVQIAFIDPSAKLLGKLDDIPAFANDRRDDGFDDPVDEPELSVAGQDMDDPESFANMGGTNAGTGLSRGPSAFGDEMSRGVDDYSRAGNEGSVAGYTNGGMSGMNGTNAGLSLDDDMDSNGGNSRNGGTNVGGTNVGTSAKGNGLSRIDGDDSSAVRAATGKGKNFGVFEYAMVALAAIVVIGLALGVVYLLFGE